MMSVRKKFRNCSRSTTEMVTHKLTSVNSLKCSPTSRTKKRILRKVNTQRVMLPSTLAPEVTILSFTKK